MANLISTMSPSGPSIASVVPKKSSAAINAIISVMAFCTGATLTSGANTTMSAVMIPSENSVMKVSKACRSSV